MMIDDSGLAKTALLANPSQTFEECVDSFEIPLREDIVGITARWVGRRACFTMAELRDHLIANEAVDPNEVRGSKITALFADIQGEVVDYYAEQGETVLWVDTPAELAKSGPKQYTLGHVRREVEKPEAPDEHPGLPDPRPRAVPTPKVDRLLASVATLVRGLGSVQLVRDVQVAIGEALELDPDEAQQVIKDAVRAGLLFRKNVSGYSAVTAEIPQAASTAADSADTRAETLRSEEERLADLERYLEVTSYVMKSLAALRDINMGQPYDRLWRRGSLGERMDFDEFKRYVRRMESDGLITILKNARLHTKTGRSKELYGSKIVIVDRETKLAWKVNPKETFEAFRDQALDALIAV